MMNYPLLDIIIPPAEIAKAWYTNPIVLTVLAVVVVGLIVGAVLLIRRARKKSREAAQAQAPGQQENQGGEG